MFYYLDRERVEKCGRVKCAFECFETLVAFERGKALITVTQETI